LAFIGGVRARLLLVESWFYGFLVMIKIVMWQIYNHLFNPPSTFFLNWCI